jgi:FkbM family methyltransferase
MLEIVLNDRNLAWARAKPRARVQATAGLKFMNAKPFIRFLYASVPGAAALRFFVKDRMAASFAKPEYRPVGQLTTERPLIVDVGANRGQSIAAFKAFGRRPIVIAFEPEPISVARLIDRYANDESVTIRACALGSRPGKITFYAPKYGYWDCDGMAAVDRETAINWLRDPGRMFGFDERKLTVREHPVECRTLDSFDLSPTLVKLHAQGAELTILQGSIRTLMEYQPALMCAFATPDVSSFLEKLDYHPYVYGPIGFTGGIAARPVTFTWYLTGRHLRESFRQY